MQLEKLSEPFPADKISWRVGSTGKSQKGVWATILAYLDARDVMDRLDNCVGQGGWQTETKTISGGFAVGVGIKIENEWVYKWDVADETDIEAIKGGFSGAFKRAAVHWGIGRYLYGLGRTYAEVSESKQYDWEYATHDSKNKKGEKCNFWWKVPAKCIALLGGNPELKKEEPPEAYKKHSQNPYVNEIYDTALGLKNDNFNNAVEWKEFCDTHNFKMVGDSSETLRNMSKEELNKFIDLLKSKE